MARSRRTAHCAGGIVKRFRTAQGNAVLSTTMSARARTLFGLAATLPLLAPYELLLRPDWPDKLSMAWVLCALVSLGALAVTVLLAGVAVFGLNRQVEFVVNDGVVRVTDRHLLMRARTTRVPFADATALEVISHDWSDGPSTYDLRLMPGSGKGIDFGDFATRQEAESVRAELLALLAGKQVSGNQDR